MEIHLLIPFVYFKTYTLASNDTTIIYLLIVFSVIIRI